MSVFQPDLVIKDPDGRPIAVVEVKNRQDLSSDIAIEMRRNMLRRGLPAQVPYFLLLSQDVGYLWRESRQDNPDAPPAYEFPMDKVVKRYSHREPGQRLYGTELELLVLQWLTNLSTKPQKMIEEPERTLELAGFNDSIKEAMVLIEEEL
jgi:hypothetical protein